MTLPPARYSADMSEDIAAIPARIAAYVAEHIPSLVDAHVVLAASGGADSAALVSLLCESRIVAPERAVVAHFDHRLRDAGASAADRAAVTALAARYGLRVVTGAWESPRPSEAAAREARYRFLHDVARTHIPRSTRNTPGVTLHTPHSTLQIATGHTADDQAETVLLHAMRGAGLHGLAGMAASAPFPFGGRDGPAIARPLLCVTRAETRAWCAARGIAFCDDATNQDRRYARNRLRLDLLPALTERGAAIPRILALAEHARALAVALDDTLAPLVRESAEGVVVSRDALAALPPEARTHVARLAVVRLLGDARDLGRAHYERIAAAVTGRTGACLEFPRGMRAIVDADAIVLTLRPGEPDAIDPDLEIPLPFAGPVGGWLIDVRPSSAGGALALPHGAVIRRRRPGDRMRTRAGHRKLQDVLVDAKVPQRHRDAAPVIASGALVYWTPWVVGECEQGTAYAVTAARP